MRRFERVLIAVDQNDRAEAPIRLALELTANLGAELIVFHSISEQERDERQHLPPPSNYVDVMVEETRRELAMLVESLGGGENSPTVRVIARTGEPAELIRSLAETEECDLVIIGLRRRSRVGKFLLGSNLQDVLMTTDRPVIAVPVADAESDPE